MAWTLVTGGAKGLGAQICKALAAQGKDVLLHYRSSKEEALYVAQECRALGIKAEILQADFSSQTGVEDLVKEIDANDFLIENLINNVGNFLIRSPLETTIGEWNGLFQTNLHAPFLLIQRLIPSIKNLQGNIINIGTAGIKDMRTDIKYTAYTITKSSLYLLTRALARELAGSQVRVNMVSPGEMTNSICQRGDGLPMKRAATLQEVVEVIIFLMDKKNGYITGQNIEVAGGYAL